MATKPKRTWRQLDEQWFFLTGDDCTGAQSIMVKVARHAWEGPADFPMRLVDDAQEFSKVLLELIAHGATTEEIGSFVELQLEPVREALLGSWTWTKFVRFAAPRETSPWSDSEGLR